MEFRLGELFCGPGGIGCAAITAAIDNAAYKIKHAWASDYDKDACDTFIKNIAKNEKTVICKDIGLVRQPGWLSPKSCKMPRILRFQAEVVRKLKFPNNSISELDFNLLKSISDIDALAFGFPCNDFSVVGEQKGVNGYYGSLYSYGIKALKKFKPIWFLAENVGGLKNANDGEAFKVILNDMFNAGYSVYPHLYKFEEYGIPQARHRIIIIGIRKDQNVVYKAPSTSLYKKKLRTCREAIENPPIVKDAPNNELTKQSVNVVKRLKYIKPGENAFTAKIPDDLKLNIASVKISQIYRRLDPNKPAYTITGSGGGGTHVYHWKEDRALTNRERARLQTFPDDFVFHGSKESVRKQIGMAVPVDGVKIIFEALLNCFAGIDYKSDKHNLTPLIQEDQIDIYNARNPGSIYLLQEDEEFAAV